VNGLVVFVVNVLKGRQLLQIVRLENRVTLEATHIIHRVSPHQKFRARMFTARHTKVMIIPILRKATPLSSAVFVVPAI
jgi:hypothetical protein